MPRHVSTDRCPARAMAVVLAMAILAPATTGMVRAHETETHGSGGAKSSAMPMMHNHDAWAPPPASYMGKTQRDWADSESVARGRALYAKHCVNCHGVDGRGAGSLAADLTHKPANLNHHFHTAPGEGDAYLFWRVSEGGTVEPFRSMESTMPAFKEILDPAARWDVLSYVHQAFHKGFKDGKAGSH